MLKMRFSCLVILLTGSLALAACAGGRGGNLVASMPDGATPPTTTAPPPPPTPAPTSPPPPVFWDTALTGAVGVPAPASFGDSPMPAQIAPPDGSSFETANTSAFPVLATSLQATPTGLSAVSSNQSATAVVTSTGKNTYYNPCVLPHDQTGIGANIQLSIPSLNLNVSWSTEDIHNLDISRFADSLTYVLLGYWRLPSPSGVNALHSGTWYVFGYETPATSIPTTGQANFIGRAQGTVFTPTAGTIGEASVDGPAAFSADFASGKITGAFTKLRVSPNGGQETLWNDVSVSASIAAGSNRFSGATAVTSTPQGLFTLGSSATGSINGAFYGPAAQNLGAIWTLSDGTTSAIGGVVAGH